ncbi:MAG TPA: hypothetical protein VKA15_01420 [Isosphaeraceae bacterium]|nr:hypothetical protein [Isosphaeraceae bacterium]
MIDLKRRPLPRRQRDRFLIEGIGVGKQDVFTLSETGTARIWVPIISANGIISCQFGSSLHLRACHCPHHRRRRLPPESLLEPTQ